MGVGFLVEAEYMNFAPCVKVDVCLKIMRPVRAVLSEVQAMVAKLAQGGDISVRLVPSLVLAVGVASASLGAVLAAGALTVAQTATDSNTPSTTTDADAVHRPATIEESFPSLGAVPSRPKPSTTSAERIRITNSLTGDRDNAHYTGQALRGGEEAAAAPPRSLPPVAAGSIPDPAAERRAAQEAQGLTAFGSYQQRGNGAQVPPPLPSVPEAASYASRPAPVRPGGMASTVPRAVATPSAAATDAATGDAADPAAPAGGAVRPLRVPPSVASLPAPPGQEQRPVAAGPTPQVIASIRSVPAGERAPVPSPASVAAARGTAPAAVAVAAPASSGSRYAPPAGGPAPALRVAGGAAPAVAPGGGSAAPVPAGVQAQALAPQVAGASRPLPVQPRVARGQVVADIYQQQLAETRNPTTVPASLPQFEISSAPALPVGPNVPMTPAMQAALSGPQPARVPVRLDNGSPRAEAPARATTAAAAVRPATDGGTVIGFTAGSIDLSPAARESIRQMAAALHSGATQVRIVGYAKSKGDGGDPVGAFGLSIDRANAVAAELMAAGVPARAVKVEAVVADAAARNARGKGPEAVVFVE